MLRPQVRQLAVLPVSRGWQRDSIVAPNQGQCCALDGRTRYCNFAYSALACFRTGTSGSASFQIVKNS